MLGSLLKQVINGVEKVPEEVWRALVLRGREKIVSGRGPQLSGIVRMLHLIMSLQLTFMIIDALDAI